MKANQQQTDLAKIIGVHKSTIITQILIDQVMDKLNNRPRKYLGSKTPDQVFSGINPSVALAS